VAVNYRETDTLARKNFPQKCEFDVEIYGKNDFVEVSKDLAMDLKIILLDHQNNYVERSYRKY